MRIADQPIPLPDAANEEFWREFLTRGDSMERAGRRIFKRIPHEPRCRMCAAPFAGLAKWLNRQAVFAAPAPPCPGGRLNRASARMYRSADAGRGEA